MKLDDKVIGHVAKVLQVAIITGTDVVDNLRSMELSLDENSGKLTVDNDYLKSFDRNVNGMIEEIKAQNDLQTN